MNIINLNRGAEDARANCYLIRAGNAAAVVDPGINKEVIRTTLVKMGLTLKYILITHGHFDHIFDLDRLRKETGAAAAIHTLDAEMLSDAEKNGGIGFLGLNRTFKPADILLDDGGEIVLTDEDGGQSGGKSGGQSGGESAVIRVIHTPGHTRGSVCYSVGGVLITGDTLFSGGIGRSDLYGGDPDELYRSLRKLSSLDGDYEIYPGHGGTGSLRAELSLHLEYQ